MKNLIPPGKSEGIFLSDKLIDMKNLYNTNEKATVCAEDTCVTVYGDTAKLIQAVVLCTVLVVSVAYIAKALR